jgi:hypothetical protein
MFAGVMLVIFWAFHSGYGTSRPHAEAQVLAVFWGGISAVAWALSVVGTLVWKDFDIVSSIKWNSRFNFLAAGFAATAVGYTAKVNFGEVVVSTNGGLRLPFFRRPRESGGPGLQAPCPPPPCSGQGQARVPAFAGMTVRWVGAER